MKNKLAIMLSVVGLTGMGFVSFHLGKDIVRHVQLEMLKRERDSPCTPVQYEHFKEILPEINEMHSEENDFYSARLKHQTEYEIKTFEKSREGKAYLREKHNNP